MNDVSVGVVFITHAAREHLRSCIPPIKNSELNPRILVINSCSSDGTAELAKAMGIEVVVIKRSEFNQGLTREIARKRIGTDIVVMMTPDAYATSSEMLNELLDPIISGKAAISYARQIPRPGASIFEAYPRLFNYPEESSIRRISDVSKLGVHTFFCSDSCTAYDNSVLDEVGGFEETLVSEDYIVCAKILIKGYAIAYQSRAVVEHSHRYSLFEEFKRYYDIGLTRAMNKWLIDLTGKSENRGKKYFRGLMDYVKTSKGGLMPYALLQSGIKMLGYKIGFYGRKMPLWIKKRLSGQDYYWD